MNRLTLRHRLLLLTLLPSTLIAVALVAYFTITGMHTLEGELRAKGLATVRYLAPISEYGIIAGQIESLHSLAQASIQESGVKAAIIVNQKGRAIAVSGHVALGAEILRHGPKAAGIVGQTERWIAFGAPVIRSMNEVDSLFDTSPGPSSSPEIIGHVFVEFDKADLYAKQRDLLQRSLIIVFVGLALLAGLAIAMADTLASPVMRLVKAIREMSSGHLDTRVPTTSSGEIGVLEQGFNQMASRIEEVHQSMQSRIEEATAQLAYQARHDALTGLLNRREFEHRLEKALSSVQAGGSDYCLLFIDLDRFKPVNDTCGHLAGDELLRQIALLFQGRLRDDDTVARLGGDEFGILLADCAAPRGRQVAEDICALTSAYRFIWQDKVFAIGASIGLTPITRRASDIQELLAAADNACQQAKESGRNQVLEQEATATTDRRQDKGNWASRIANGLIEGRLLVEAMPLSALQHMGSGEYMVELTARLHEPGQPSIALSALMDAAERYDLSTSIDQHFIELAISALARTRHHRKSLTCFVPISRISLGKRELIDHIARTLALHELSGDGLCILFNEDVTTHHTSQALEFTRQVRALGCQIGLDDFGGGLSSFSHLRSLAPDYVKLSRSLTRDIAGNRGSTALLRAVREITADQNIHTIADGIDDPADIIQLRELGIDFAQGKGAAPIEPFDVWLEGAVIRSL